MPRNWILRSSDREYTSCCLVVLQHTSRKRNKYELDLSLSQKKKIMMEFIIKKQINYKFDVISYI